nr:uncharacterized protein LOC111413903 [Onthophagus taurus]XP_022900809.1 uncharacterized protein LOC111413904 [Onthophagus taurus]
MFIGFQNKMKTFFVIIFLFSLIITMETLNLFRKKVVKLDKLQNCQKYPNAPIKFTENHLQKQKKIYVLSTKIVVKQTIPADLKVDLTLTRCNTKDSPDTCENYQKITIKKMCDLIPAKNKPWTPFMDIMTPQMSCPIKKGIYIVKNATFDGDAFSTLPIDGYYWKVEANVKEGVHKSTVLCLNLEGQIVPV